MVMRAAVCLGLMVLASCASTRRHTGESKDFAPERRFEIAAGKMVELNLDVPASTIVAAEPIDPINPIDPIEVVFEASVAVAWNIHVHDGQEVQYLQQGTDASGVLLYTPSRPGPISLLWENKTGATVNATIRVDGLPVGTTAHWEVP